MLFHSSIRKELARSFVATLVVLITVVMSMMLIRSLGLAAKGSVNPRDVIMLMGYSVLGHLATIMTLSLFIAVTNTFGRMYRESEMAVWFASGRGLAGFVSPVLRFAWPILLAIASLALVVWPWTAEQSQKLRSQYEQRGDLERVSAGQFQESASGSRVFFIDATQDEVLPGGSNAASNGATASSTAGKTDTMAQLTAKQARNVFISQIEGNQQIITSARTGRIETINGEQFLVLGQGQRMEQALQNAEVKISEFETYSVLIGAAKVQGNVSAPVKTLGTLTLLNQPTDVNLAELSWRIGLALAALNLLLLALLLSAVNPRAGRGLGTAFALLGFVVYYNLLNVGFSRIATGRVDFGLWMLALHGGILLGTLLWMAIRHRQWSWHHLLRPRARSNALPAA
ncbi:MAG: LPS export ABC transporter permease LptF [Brachymonas sp.]|nr:LPS export ABC transporter permease LptF [Brachymonas sp.]